MIDEVHLF